MPYASTQRPWPVYAAQDDPHAAKWVARQRRTSGAAAISGPRPNPTKPPHWDSMLALLRGYVDREGHARVPLNHSEHGHRLGVWLSEQWARQRGGYLSRARVLRLEDAGVEWEKAPPPAEGVIDPRHFNERKWDPERAIELGAAMDRSREWEDAATAAAEPHWRPYRAEDDPHAAGWWAAQKSGTKPPPISVGERQLLRSVGRPSRSSSDGAAASAERPAVRGLAPDLARRLAEASRGLRAQSQKQRTASSSSIAQQRRQVETGEATHS